MESIELGAKMADISTIFFEICQNWPEWIANHQFFTLSKIYELKKMESIEVGVKMTTFSTIFYQIGRNWSKWLTKTNFFTLSKIYELKKMESIELGVKMSDIVNYYQRKRVGYERDRMEW